MTAYTPAQVTDQCRIIADRMMMGDDSAHNDFWALYDELEQQEYWPHESPAPIYKSQTAPLTREDVQVMIDRAIAAHTNEGLLASAGGALILGAMVWAMAAG